MSGRGGSNYRKWGGPLKKHVKKGSEAGSRFFILGQMGSTECSYVKLTAITCVLRGVLEGGRQVLWGTQKQMIWRKPEVQRDRGGGRKCGTP